MFDEKNFILISGEFTPEEARNNLMNLLLKRIEYHGVESFGCKIRLGEYDSYHDKQKKYIEETTGTLKTLLASALKDKRRLKIACYVNVSIIP